MEGTILLMVTTFLLKLLPFLADCPCTFTDIPAILADSPHTTTGIFTKLVDSEFILQIQNWTGSSTLIPGRGTCPLFFH